MEDGLRDLLMDMNVKIVISLNPCSYGRWSQRAGEVGEVAQRTAS